MLKMKKDIWDIIFWVLLGISLLVIILKLTGVINTPDLIAYLPVITLIFASGIVYQKLLTFMNSMYERTDYLKTKIDNIEHKTIENEKNIFALEKNQDFFSVLLKRKK